MEVVRMVDYGITAVGGSSAELVVGYALTVKGDESVTVGSFAPPLHRQAVQGGYLCYTTISIKFCSFSLSQ